MEIEVKNTFSLHISLNFDEASWLQRFIQNYPGDPQEEDVGDCQKRKWLFDNLQQATS